MSTVKSIPQKKSGPCKAVIILLALELTVGPSFVGKNRALAQEAYAASVSSVEKLSEFFNSAEGANIFKVADEQLYVPSLVKQFYENRNYKPAWNTSKANELLQVIKNASEEGMNPNYYHRELIEKTLQSSPQEPDRKLNLELLLSDAFLTYASNMSGSLTSYRLDPKIHYVYWQNEKSEADLPQVLESGLKSSLQKSISDLMPHPEYYNSLKKLLKDFQSIAAQGGWPIIPADPKPAKGAKKGKPLLSKDAEDDRVPLLRKHLAISGDLKQSSDSKVFDAELEDAVKKFQFRHGLEETGAVGPETMAALNVPVEKRILQIKANLERLRWLGNGLGTRYIHVNIPEFTLRGYEDGKEAVKMKVVVGQTHNWQTPLVSSTITDLIFNPQWHVPPNIIKKEMLRHIQKDPNYLKKQGMKAYVREGGKTEQVDIETYDWENARASSLSIVQDSGRGNALGKIKFMFKSPFDIYLHDTSEKAGFNKRFRPLSHGCVRVEKPMELAHFVSHGDEKWSDDKIEKEIEKGRNQTVPLKNPISINILYWTVWVDENGITNFRDDIYGIDQKIAEVMAGESSISKP